VEVARRTSRHRSHLFASIIAALIALFALSAVGVGTAHADEVGTDYDFIFSGNVKDDDTPLKGVLIKVDGNGYSEQVVTDADGKWKIGVPEKKKYTITLDESTLPKGTIVVKGAASVEAEFGLTGNKSVNFFLGEGVRETVSIGDQLFSRIINGLNFGLMLALAAIGASLVFGTTGLSNFAHAEMVTFGAVMTLVFGVFLKFPMFVAIPIAVLLSAAFGLTLDAAIWRPLRRKGIGLTQLLIVSIGLSLALRYTFQFFIGGSIFQLPGSSEKKIQIFGPISLTITDMVSMGVSILVLAAVAWWLVNTRIGKATRAISDNPSLAAASGINVDGVVRIVWIVAAALAGLAGVLWAYFIPGIKWDMGAQILLLVFAAITLGGLGTAFGALVGSLIVGLLVEVSTLWIPSDLKYLGALVILIVVLLVRPQGILGRKERIG
jgi:neutral amino acid transport system permease protein